MEQAILVGLVALFGYLEVVFGNSMIQAYSNGTVGRFSVR